MKKGLLMAIAGLILVGIVSCGGGETNDGGDDDGGNTVDDKDYYYGEYENAILPFYNGSVYNTEIADPSIVKGDDGYFYIFSTARRALRSEDMCTWEVLSTSIIPRPTRGDDMYEKNDPEVWAPDCVKIGDKWVYYYALSGWDTPCGIGYATADEISGPYTDQGKLFSGAEIGIENCIDPCIYIEEDGSVYMAVGSFRGIYIVELDETGTALMGGVDYQRENKVLIGGYAGNWDGTTYEGSYIIKKDGYYYFFGSVGSCCDGENSTYRVVATRSESILGPYVDSSDRPMTLSGNGVTIGELVLWGGSSTSKQFAGPGHNSIFLDDSGDYRIIYHSYVNSDTFGTRHLMMDKLLRDENGFPHVEGKKPSYQVVKDGPRLLEH